MGLGYPRGLGTWSIMRWLLVTLMTQHQTATQITYSTPLTVHYTVHSHMASYSTSLSYFSGFGDARAPYGRQKEEPCYIAQTEAKYVTKATLKPNSMVQCEKFPTACW